METEFILELKKRDEQIDMLFKVIGRLIDEIDDQNKEPCNNHTLSKTLSKELNIPENLTKKLGLSDERFW